MSAWQWACLACNDTWRSAAREHACIEEREVREAYLAFWTTVIGWSPAMHGRSRAAIRAIIAQPVSRAAMVEWLGASWDVAGDDAARMPINAPRELA